MSFARKARLAARVLEAGLERFADRSEVRKTLRNKTRMGLRNLLATTVHLRRRRRKVIQSGLFEGKSFSIFDDGSIEIQTGSGIKQFKDFAELRAVAAAKHGYDASGRTEARS